MHLSVDAPNEPLRTGIEEMASRAVEFGDRMIEQMEERRQNEETIRTAAKDGGPLAEWREAPGVDAAAAELIDDDENVNGSLVFATAELIEKHPEVKDYLREQSGIPQKRIAQQLTAIRGENRETAWVEFVNGVCSQVIKAKGRWDSRYHEQLAASCRAVSLDGTMRNRVGQEAERKVKTKLVTWLRDKLLIKEKIREDEYLLNGNITLKFASEPDIGFYRGTFLKKNKLIAVVEIKGGKDPAGALERIGALEKTMNETPDECWRFAILGVTTTAMNERLEKLRLSDRFDLDKLLINESGEWDRFTTQVFKEALRIEYEQRSERAAEQINPSLFRASIQAWTALQGRKSIPQPILPARTSTQTGMPYRR